jgi:inward rectifier potassium channel
VGLLSVAMATSLLFARFSRPTARFLFSAVAVICPYKGIPTLMFRIANQRDNWIVEANVRVSMLLPTEITPEGHSIRRLCDLNLVRSETPLLALTWMIMHPIDPHSPLYGVDPETLHHWQSQFIVTLTGLDETVSQTIHAHHIYDSHDVVWDQRFVDVVSYDTNGDRHLDYSHFHDVVPIIELDLN